MNKTRSYLRNGLKIVLRPSVNLAPGPVGTISFIEFESMTACLSGKIPLEEIFEFKHSKTKDNSRLSAI